MLKIAARVVASAIFEFQVGTVHDNFDVAESPVFEVIRTGIAKDVVSRRVLLYLREHATEIVGIKEGLPAGVSRQRGKSFLRGRVAVQIIQDGGAGVSGLSVEAGVLRFASAGKRLQATDVKRIDGNVGFHRRRSRGSQGGLIIHAGLTD